VPLTKLTLITTDQHTRLDETLADWLTKELARPVSKAKARKLIMAGAVLLNGQRLRIAAQGLKPGSRLEAQVDTAKLFADSTARDQAFELTADRILFEDDDLIVVDKPAGLPSHPTLDESRDNLLAAVTRFLAKRDGVAEPYVGVHQRLDRDTSGVVLFTKSTRVNAAIGEIFAKHLATKTYQAITTPPPKPNLRHDWTIKNQLGKVSSRTKRSKYGAVPSGGDAAETAFHVLAKHAQGIHIEATPKTGRTHQIRVHLSEYGMPILGDDLYGKPHKSNALAPRTMLHASRLTFPHPITKQAVSVDSPLPDDFKQCLRRIELL
jgi:RluA family pseudouridine synthase